MATTDYVYNVPDPSGSYYSGPVSSAPSSSSAPMISLSQTQPYKEGQSPGPMGRTQYFSGNTPLESTLSSDSLSVQSNYILPSAPNAATYQGGTGTTIDANNATLANLMGATISPNKLIQYNPSNQQKKETTSLDALIASLNEKPPSVAEQYQQIAQEAGLEQKQKQVTSLTNQLNTVVAKRDADVLRVTSQGVQSGATEAIVGGRQAQINREAAISALPIQAQLSAAQGDLQLAQTHVDQMFSIVSKDMQMQYEYRQNVRQSIYSYLDKQEQRQIDALNRKDTQDFQLKTNNLNFIQDLAKTAYANGHAGVGAQLMGLLDPNNPNFVDTKLAGSYAQNMGGSTNNRTVKKGSLSNKDFVNKALSAKGVAYDDAVAAVPAGKIGVIDNATGAVGTIDSMTEYDSLKYTLI